MDRIKFLAKLVYQKDRYLADVGSDHGFFSIYVASQNPLTTIYNIEINDSPYHNSINNVKKHHLQKQIICIKNDGFRNWKGPNQFDVVCISGMGGKNIWEIISHIPKSIKINRFILSPNNNEVLLREYLTKQFKFIKDTWILDSKIYYPIIVVSKTKGTIYHTKKDMFFGKLNLLHPSTAFKKHWLEVYQHIQKHQLYLHNEKYNNAYHLIYEQFKDYL